MSITIGAAVFLCALIARHTPHLEGRVRSASWNTGDVLYSLQAPAVTVMAAAALIALAMAGGIALLDRRAANRYRRSGDAGSTPLAPRVVMERTRGIHAGQMTVTVLVPAHNEEASLPATLESLRWQTHAPHRVVVVADNCTDRTAELARLHGAEVIETRGNTAKKAGALNQALREILPGHGDNDAILVMDADTRLDPRFLQVALRRMSDDRALMAVGGLFLGEEGHGLIGQFQRNEYLRYCRTLGRRRGRVFILTGTATVFRPRALRAVASTRGTILPGEAGNVYDTMALTEDNELTIALKSLGGLMVSPPECTVVTELMPGWRTLWHQRLRWQRGALENIGAYGITPPTLRYWAQQIGIGYGVIALGSYFAALLVMLVALDHWVWFPFWLGIGLVFMAERVWTVWHGGWRARLTAALVFPELAFDMFLNLAYLRGVMDSALGRSAAWRHVAHTIPASDFEKAV
jgi:cellulose synthase/poly-beta-1,6-N-acetylglucosamine synthase-like glycosyltransferase